ncbi:hypothetical protein ACN2WE_33970 [Streptomyces sp. cg28]|uniref:hypothetical protein n=1 Tax=Streptomyces sp. cg28 TaxID=3403457 RepID=UPI003B21F6C4
MDPLVLAAGSALVSAMAADGWQRARDGMAEWWRRLRRESIESDLDTLHFYVTTARQNDDADTERALASVWHLRLQQLVDADPAMAAELQSLLDNHLIPVLPSQDLVEPGSVVMNVEARDSARTYMAGRDQHITESWPRIPPGRP